MRQAEAYRSDAARTPGAFLLMMLPVCIILVWALLLLTVSWFPLAAGFAGVGNLFPNW